MEGGRIRWKKIGGGSLRFLPNRIIKPGQIFEAYPEEIPKAFRDIVVPVDYRSDEVSVSSKSVPKVNKKEVTRKEARKAEEKAIEAMPAEVVKAAKPKYKLVEVEGGFQIVGRTGKRLLDTPLSEADAKKLLVSMNA